MRTKALLLTLATLTAALAGCTGNDNAQTPDAVGPDAPAGDDGTSPAGPDIKVRSWDGEISDGVGGYNPVLGRSFFVGGATDPEGVKVGDNATGLLVELVWGPAAGAVPTDLNLIVWDPSEAGYQNTEGMPGSPDAPARLFFDHPAAGTWMAMAWPNGATVLQGFTIHASVFYGGDMPEGYTAVP